MKKALALALVLFTSFMSYVVVGGFIQKQQNENNISSNLLACLQGPVAERDSIDCKLLTITRKSNHVVYNARI